jgi:hypothetical protein
VPARYVARRFQRPIPRAARSARASDSAPGGDAGGVGEEPAGTAAALDAIGGLRICGTFLTCALAV